MSNGTPVSEIASGIVFIGVILSLIMMFLAVANLKISIRKEKKDDE